MVPLMAGQPSGSKGVTVGDADAVVVVVDDIVNV